MISGAFGNLALEYNVYYGSVSIRRSQPVNECIRLGSFPCAPFGDVHVAVPKMALEPPRGSRALPCNGLLDAKADNLFVDEELYALAFASNDADGMQQQMKMGGGETQRISAADRRRPGSRQPHGARSAKPKN